MYADKIGGKGGAPSLTGLWILARTYKIARFEPTG